MEHGELYDNAFWWYLQKKSNLTRKSGQSITKRQYGDHSFKEIIVLLRQASYIQNSLENSNSEVLRRSKVPPLHYRRPDWFMHWLQSYYWFRVDFGAFFPPSQIILVRNLGQKSPKSRWDSANSNWMNQMKVAFDKGVTSPYNTLWKEFSLPNCLL